MQGFAHSVRAPLHHARMIGAALICSDEACAETIEVVAPLHELDHLICHGCECTLTVLAVWEVDDRAPMGTVVALRSGRTDLALAA